MKRRTFSTLIAICLSCLFWLGATLGYQESAAAIGDPLPSWQDRETKATIIDFVTDVTDPCSDNFVESDDRIAVFDNDGTLWSEKDLIQGLFIKEQRSLGTGWATEDYIAAAREFLTGSNESHYPYVNLIYKPMKELLEYLQDNDFQTYICSGGDIDFVRSFAEDYYHIPPEKVIGSTVALEFDKENPTELTRGPIVDWPKTLEESKEEGKLKLVLNDFFFNDSENKPVSIERYIGKRPIMAVGNSNGDLEMLQYTDDGEGRDLMMLVRHNDEEREHYRETVKDEHVNEALKEAYNRGWSLIKVKNDFKKVFLGDDLP